MIKIEGLEIELSGGNGFIIKGDFFSNHGIFYYDRETTKKYHKENLKNGYSVVNQASGKYKQLIGADSNIANKRVYTRLINAYIKGER